MLEKLIIWTIVKMMMEIVQWHCCMLLIQLKALSFVHTSMVTLPVLLVASTITQCKFIFTLEFNFLPSYSLEPSYLGHPKNLINSTGTFESWPILSMSVSCIAFGLMPYCFTIMVGHGIKNQSKKDARLIYIHEKQRRLAIMLCIKALYLLSIFI